MFLPTPLTTKTWKSCKLCISGTGCLVVPT